MTWYNRPLNSRRLSNMPEGCSKGGFGSSLALSLSSQTSFFNFLLRGFDLRLKSWRIFEWADTLSFLCLFSTEVLFFFERRFAIAVLRFLSNVTSPRDWSNSARCILEMLGDLGCWKRWEIRDLRGNKIWADCKCLAWLGWMSLRAIRKLLRYQWLYNSWQTGIRGDLALELTIWEDGNVEGWCSRSGTHTAKGFRD